MHDRGDPVAENARKDEEKLPTDSDDDWGSQWKGSPKKPKASAKKMLMPTAKKRAKTPGVEVEESEPIGDEGEEILDDDYCDCDEDLYAEPSEFTEAVTKAAAVGADYAMGTLQGADESGATSSGGDEMIKLSRKELAEILSTIESARASAAHAGKLSVAAAHAFRREHEKLVAVKEKFEKIAANR